VKKGEKLSEENPEPKESPKPKPKPKPFHCEHCGRDGHLPKFCFRRKQSGTRAVMTVGRSLS
jgi:hypothetical protein